MIDRERKLDISKLPEDQVNALSIQIGDKVRLICDEAAVKVNQILAVYGMSAKIAIQFDTPEVKEEPKIEVKKRAPRAKKSQNANLKNE